MRKANRKTLLTVLAFLPAMVVLPAGARSVYGKSPTILLVSDCSAPGTYTGTPPNDVPGRDNSLVSFLEGLGYTVDTSGMNKAYQELHNPFNDMPFVITGTEPPRERFEPISFTYSTVTGSGTIAGILDARACGGPNEVYFEAPMPVPAIVDPKPFMTPPGSVGTITEATGSHNDQGKTVGIDWSGLGPVTLTGTADGTTYTVDVELIFGPSGDISYNNPDEDPFSSYDPLGEDYVYTWTIEISDDALAEHGGDAVSPGGDDNPRMAVYLAVGREEPNGGCHRFTQVERQFNVGPDAYTNDDETTDANKWSKFAAYQDLGIYYGWRDMSNIGDGSFQIDSIVFGGNLLVDTDNIIPQPGIIFVDADAAGGGDGSSWADAYNFLQDALADSAASGKKIFVAEGIYKPDQTTANPGGTGDRLATFHLINDVGVYGGFPSGGGMWEQRDPDAYETILSGDLNGDDGPDFANNGENSYHVVTGSGTNETTILDGFTITGGNANGTGSDADGGGMYNSEYSSPTVTNCTFSGNSAADDGGGMYNAVSASLMVTNCTFSGNTANYGGGMFNNTSSPTVTNCSFTANEATYNGGGMFNQGSSPTVTNCTFSGNTADAGGGMYNWSNSSPTMTNCTFSGNTALSGTYGGGGMFNNTSSNPIVTNCTFTGNTATSGGGMYNYRSSPTVTNCILWGDALNEIIDDSSSTTVTYSDIQGGWPDVNNTNIDADPRFVDPNNPDPNLVNLRLLPDSPCIDKGSNNAPNLPPTDLAGNQRIFDGDGNGSFIVDMGAYEFGSLNLLAHWKLDESSGSTACDSSGDNHGTLQPPTPPLWRPAGGWFNGALQLDGADDYVDCGNDDSLNITNQITLSVWVNTNDSGNWEHNPYVSKGDHSYAIKHHSSNNIEFFIYDSDWHVVWYPVDSSFNGAWHHLAGTYDGSQLKLYVDGELEANSPHAGSIALSTFNVNIGRNAELTDRFYDGLIDDVAIFDRALTPAEIAQLRDNGGAWFITDSALKALWELDESSGGTAYDSTGNGINGTLVPGPPPVWQPAGGWFNGALQLDGVDDYVDCGNDEKLNITDAITLSVWVKTNDSGNGEYNPYVSKGDHSYALKHQYGNNIEFVIYDDWWYYGWYPVDSSFNGAWHHLAGTYDGGMLRLYVDGVEQLNFPYAGSIAASSFNVNIGRNAEITDRFYDGLIDDVAIFSRALNDTEINNLKDNGGASFISDPNLSALWELDESSGTIAHDSSGNGLNGGLEPTSPLWHPAGGQLDGALEFDGWNDCVYIPNESRFDITYQVTVSAWIKVNAFERDWQSIVTKGDSAWRLHRLRDTNSIAFHCNLYPDFWGAEGSINVNNGQWHHVAGVYDGTQAYLYVDGVLDNSEAVVSLIGTNDYPVMIGENAERPGRFWNGLIDDVRIYTCALGPSEVYQLYSNICYVDADATGNNNGSSWTDAFNYLQDALAQPIIPGEIRVAEGTYKPDANSSNPSGSGDRAATFQLINGVTLKGGYAGFGQPDPNTRDCDLYETTLSGDINTPSDDTDNCYHVVTSRACDLNTVLEGFTITGGNANGTNPEDRGAGMYNNNTSPTVTNCTFSGNIVGHDGGGMYNVSSNPTLTNCTFSGNTANYGGGMFNFSNSSPTVTNCSFTGNEATYNGGGMFNQGSSPTVTNCTFSGNTADAGGGMYNYINSYPTVTNCILWGDTPDEILDYDYPDSNSIVSFSDVQDGWAGTGNIDADPRFVDANNPDPNLVNLRLRPGSPCIDAGNNTAVPSSILKDLAGKLRYADDPCTTDTGDDGMTGRPVVDMGAYEFQGCGTTSQNLLANPGFEVGDATGWVTNWGWNLTADTNQVHDGNYSGLASGRTASWQGAWQSLLGLMDDGKTYRISGWVRLQNPTSDYVALTVKKTDSASTNYYGIDNARGYDDQWVHLDGTLALDVIGEPTELYVYFEGPDPEVNFYVDDAAVTEVMGDMNHNGGVDFIDFSLFASYYGFDCSTQDCGRANLNDCDNTINELDLLIFCNNWLIGTEP